MITLQEAIARLGGILDRDTLEDYIAHHWVRPVVRHETWHFEEIDIARLELVHHLRREHKMQDDAMDIVLSLLDQLYGYRENIRRIHQALMRQPQKVQAEILALMRDMEKE